MPLSSCRLLWGRQWGLKDKGILVGEYLQGLGELGGREMEGRGKKQKTEGKKGQKEEERKGEGRKKEAKT